MSFISRVVRTGKIITNYEGEAIGKTISKIEDLHKAFLTNLTFPPEKHIFDILPYKSLIEKNKEKLSELISMETGKSELEAMTEVEKTLKHVNYYYDYYLKYYESSYGPHNLMYGRIFNRMLPIGVLLKIVPFNFPLWLAFKFLIPNLCVGNTVIIRPPSTCLQLYQFLEEEIEKIKPPSAKISFFAEEGLEEIISNPHLAGISFTGSLTLG